MHYKFHDSNQLNTRNFWKTTASTALNPPTTIHIVAVLKLAALLAQKGQRLAGLTNGAAGQVGRGAALSR